MFVRALESAISSALAWPSTTISLAVRRGAAAGFLFEICAEELAGESRRAAVFDSAHVNVDHVEWENFLAAQAVALVADLVQNRQTDLGHFGRLIALPVRERAFKNGAAEFFEKVRQVHGTSPKSFAASMISRAMGAATWPP